MCGQRGWSYVSVFVSVSAFELVCVSVAVAVSAAVSASVFVVVSGIYWARRTTRFGQAKDKGKSPFCWLPSNWPSSLSSSGIVCVSMCVYLCVCVAAESVNLFRLRQICYSTRSRVRGGRGRRSYASPRPATEVWPCLRSLGFWVLFGFRGVLFWFFDSLRRQKDAP